MSPMKLPIYMDNHSTTLVDPKVLEAMMPYYTEAFGNAASKSHSFGWRAEAAVEKARGQVAHLLGASPEEIIFTSGATESDNLAILGIAEMYGEKGNHIISVQTEHHVVLDPCRHLQSKGFDVTFLPVDRYGRVDPEAVQQAITSKTILISIMSANNEIGTLQPISEIGKIAKAKGILFHSDAVQSVGKIPLRVDEVGVDLVSISAHKTYGPKGVGALYVRRRNPRVRLAPLFYGGGHERGLRSGTLNVPGIVGLGMALEIAEQNMEAESAKLKGLRDKLFKIISDNLDEIFLNGHPTERLPNNLNLSFSKVNGAALLMGMDDVAVSSGSACTSASPEPSYVLSALGIEKDLAQASLRFGLGRFNTEEEVDYAAKKTIQVVKQLRKGFVPGQKRVDPRLESRNINDVHSKRSL